MQNRTHHQPASPVAMTSTISETPTALDNLEAVHVALRKPVMANIARNELAPPIVPGQSFDWKMCGSIFYFKNHIFFTSFALRFFWKVYLQTLNTGCVAAHIFPYRKHASTQHWVQPRNASHHHDYYIFSNGICINLHLPLLVDMLIRVGGLPGFCSGIHFETSKVPRLAGAWRIIPNRKWLVSPPRNGL